jgi:hypothetical protein
MKTYKNNLTISGRHKHAIAGMGPLTIVRVTLKTAAKVVSYAISTTRTPEEGGFRGIGAAFAGGPVQLFNSTANKCVLEQDESLVLELFRDEDRLEVEVTIGKE